MPQLPSGRIVAIDPDPLITLIDERSPFTAHKLMDIKTVEDLFYYVELVYIVPASEAPIGSIPPKLHANALPCPPGHAVIASGKRLSELPEVAMQWSAADREAMDEFVMTRAIPHLEKFLDKVKQAQDESRKSRDITTRVLSAWHDQGIHPMQENDDQNS